MQPDLELIGMNPDPQIERRCIVFIGSRYQLSYSCSMIAVLRK
jgi:hypothetical protein